MTPSEALLHLVRLGLKGDVPSVRRLTKKLLKELDLDSGDRHALADLLAAAPESSSVRWAQSPSSRAEPSLLFTFEPGEACEKPILAAPVAEEIEQIVAERARRDELEAAGLIPTRTILLTGPPGVGKTLTARYLANRLGLPLHRVDLSLLMSSYLGKTGQNLRTAILEARESPCVLLVDEFDAIAKRRDDPADVGELKRIVNVLLMELEEWPSSGLLIAATNHPELLDRAIWRRFERVVPIDLPDQGGRATLVLRELHQHGRKIAQKTLDIVAVATEGGSGSDLVTLVRSAVRRSVLQGTDQLEQFLLEGSLDRLAGRAALDSHARTLYCHVAHDLLGASQREIAQRLNISHVTVGRTLRINSPSSSKRSPRKETDA